MSRFFVPMNQVNWKDNGVDPRTRMFIYNILLGSVHANQLQGPLFDVSIRFNQLSSNNYGFGIGWELALSRIDVETNTLIMADGRRYTMVLPTHATPDSPIIGIGMSNYIACEFSLDRLADRNYRLLYKNGIIEYLDNKGRLVSVKMPSGRIATLKWVENTHLLNRIEDEKDRLISFDYSDSRLVKIEKKNSSGDPITEECTINEENELTNIILKDKDREFPRHRFEYQKDSNDFCRISSASSLERYDEEYKVIYETQSSRDRNLYLVQSIDQSIDNKTVRTTQYSSPSGNFSSFANITLYDISKRQITGYETETKLNGVKIIRRQYNADHQLLIEMEGEDNADKPLDRFSRMICYQYNNNYFPFLATNVSEFETINGTVYSGPATQKNYDPYGNIIHSIDEKGLRKTSIYQQPSRLGDDIFAKYLEEEQVSSINTPQSTLAEYHFNRVQVQRYTYHELNVPNSNKKIRLVKDVSNKIYTDNTLAVLDHDKKFSKTVFSYHRSGDFFGCLASCTEYMDVASDDALPENGKTINYSYYVSDNGASITCQESNNADSVLKTTASNVFTGVLDYEIDENTAKTTYQYDSLGRLLRKTLRADTSHAATETYSYTLNSVTARQWNGISFQRNFNRLGLMIEEFVTMPGFSTPAKLLSRTTYNALHQVTSEETFDYSVQSIMTSPAILHDKTEYHYDVYGELLSITIKHDNFTHSKTLIFRDIPYKISRIENQPENTILREEVDIQNAVTSKALFMKDDSTKLWSEYIYYDSLNRPAETKDAAGNIKKFKYDNYGRIVEEDGGPTWGVKKTKYAPCNGSLPEEIKIDENIVLISKFDDAFRKEYDYRLGIITKYSYDPSISKLHPANQKSFAYLGSELNQAHADDTTPQTAYTYYQHLAKLYSKSIYTQKDGETETYTYLYNPDGRLLSAATNTSLASSYEYDFFSHVKTEKTATPFHDSNISHLWSVDGRILKTFFQTQLAKISNKDSQYLEAYEYKQGSLAKATAIIEGVERVSIQYARSGGKAFGSYSKLDEITYRIMLDNKTTHQIKKTVSHDAQFRQNGCAYYLIRPNGKSAQLAVLRWEWDATNRIKRFSHQLSDQPEHSETFHYDGKNQLRNWTCAGEDHLGRDEYNNELRGIDYDYDALGNVRSITSKYRHAPIVSTANYIYSPQSGRLDVIHRNTVPRGAPKTITHRYDRYSGNVNKILMHSLEGGLKCILYEYKNNAAVKDISVSFPASNDTPVYLSNEAKFYFYDAEERLIGTNDGSGYAASISGIFDQPNTRTVNRFSCNSKISTTYYSSTDEKSFEGEMIFFKVEDRLECAFTLSADHSVSTKLYLNMPDGTPVATIDQLDAGTLSIERYTRNPSGQILTEGVLTLAL
ncbi:hypothetical protein [Chromobacterium sp. CV08]|uniref:hypothetical protein n=1 Tax=Chromobacterium sp. CV08 TaxID=3133274 RepID=UPI003DA8C282